MAALTTGLIEWGVAAAALSEEAENGDGYVVEPFADGVLVAVVDGLGHGREAAAATRVALATLRQFPSAPLPVLFARCHEGLRRTRGVVLSAASFRAREGTMAWLGVGDVEGLIERASPHGAPAAQTLLRGRGVVGSHLPPLSDEVLAVHPGDRLILATDGIRRGFAADLPRAVPSQQAADRILARYATAADDALVLVARYLGGPR